MGVRFLVADLSWRAPKSTRGNLAGTGDFVGLQHLGRMGSVGGNLAMGAGSQTTDSDDGDRLPGWVCVYDTGTRL